MKNFSQCFFFSICYILDETDPEASIFPLFEVQLCLETPDIVFRPPVQINDPQGFYVFYEGLMFDMMKMGTLISRLDPEKTLERENYGVRHRMGKSTVARYSGEKLIAIFFTPSAHIFPLSLAPSLSSGKDRSDGGFKDRIYAGGDL